MNTLDLEPRDLTLLFAYSLTLGTFHFMGQLGGKVVGQLGMKAPFSVLL